MNYLVQSNVKAPYFHPIIKFSLSSSQGLGQPSDLLSGMAVVSSFPVLLFSSLLPTECAISGSSRVGGRGGTRLSLSRKMSLMHLQFSYPQQCFSCWALMISPTYFQTLTSVSLYLASFCWAHLSPHMVVLDKYLSKETQGWGSQQAACRGRQASCLTKLPKCSCFSNSLNYSSICRYDQTLIFRHFQEYFT